MPDNYSYAAWVTADASGSIVTPKMMKEVYASIIYSAGDISDPYARSFWEWTAKPKSRCPVDTKLLKIIEI